MSKKVMCRDMENKEFEIDGDKLKFRPSIYGVLVENGKVLMSRQWDGYDFPGGGMKKYETVEQALEREFFEETGLKVKVGEVINCETEFFNPSRFEDRKHEYWNCILLHFKVERISGELSTANFDDAEKEYADMPEWIDIDKLGDIKFCNAVDSVEVVRKALK